MRWTRDETEASELAQETVFRLLASGIDRGPGSFPYGVQVLNNLARRRWRESGSIEFPTSLEALEEAENRCLEERCTSLQQMDGGMRGIESRELLGLICERIDRLPSTLRHVCQARWFLQMDYRTIASALGIAEATARGRCHRARVLLLEDTEVRRALGV